MQSTWTAKTFPFTPTGSWTSPATGITYPMGWKLEIPPLDLSIEAVPVLEQAEFAVSEFIAAAYWEGAGQSVGNAGRFAHNRRGIHGTGRIRPGTTGDSSGIVGVRNTNRKHRSLAHSTGQRVRVTFSRT